MKTVSIYALCEPGTRTLRYIGESYRPKRRLWEHWTKSKKEKNHLGHWLSQLAQCPTMIILREVPNIERQDWERCYIRNARMMGFRLVNGTDGGDGVSAGHIPWNRGISPSPEQVEKQASKIRGRKASAEEIKKQTSIRLGKKKSDNTSGFVGVCWATDKKKWQASLSGKTIGRFSKIEDAVFARALVLTSQNYGLSNT